MDDSTLAEIRKVLETGSVFEQTEALVRLKEEYPGPESLNLLLLALKDGSPTVSLLASRFLQEVPGAGRRLAAHCREASGDFQLACVNALGDIGAEWSERIEALLWCLDQTDSTVRGLAAARISFAGFCFADAFTVDLECVRHVTPEAVALLVVALRRVESDQELAETNARNGPSILDRLKGHFEGTSFYEKLFRMDR